jgi:SPP1 gp7 family putative phage head morphogenesis protein
MATQPKQQAPKLNKKPRLPRSFSMLASEYALALESKVAGPTQERQLIKAVITTINQAYAERYDAQPDPITPKGYAEGLKAIDGFQIKAMDDQNQAATHRLIEGHLKKLSNHNQNDLEDQWIKVLGISPLIPNDPNVFKILMATTSTSVDKIKTLEAIHFGSLKSMLIMSYSRGETTEDLTKKIQKQFGVTRSRARFYAVNEMGNLNAALTEHKQTEAGVTRYIWRTSEDERVRDTHATKNGEIFEWANPPEDTGHPGRDYRCRCTAEPILDDEDMPDDADFWNAFEDEPAQDPHLVAKDLRSELGLSQAVVAKDMGHSRGWLTRYETGKSALSLEDMGRLRAYYAEKGATPETLAQIFGETPELPWRPSVVAPPKPIVPKPATLGGNGLPELDAEDVITAIERGELFEFKKRATDEYFDSNDQVFDIVEARWKKMLNDSGLTPSAPGTSTIFNATQFDEINKELTALKDGLNWHRLDRVAILRAKGERVSESKLLEQDPLFANFWDKLDPVLKKDYAKEYAALISDPYELEVSAGYGFKGGKFMAGPEPQRMADLLTMIRGSDAYSTERHLANIAAREAEIAMDLADNESMMSSVLDIMKRLERRIDAIPKDQRFSTAEIFENYLTKQAARFRVEDIDAIPMHGSFKYTDLLGGRLTGKKPRRKAAKLGQIHNGIMRSGDEIFTSFEQVGYAPFGAPPPMDSILEFVKKTTAEDKVADAISKKYMRGMLRTKGGGKRPIYHTFIEDRAYHSDGRNGKYGIINVGYEKGAYKAEVITHEYGHAAETLNPVLDEAAKRYLLKHAKLSGASVTEIYKGTTETGWKLDGFSSHYSGKIYGKVAPQDHSDLRATEITSMAIQEVGTGKPIKNDGRNVNLIKWLVSVVSGDFQ